MQASCDWLKDGDILAMHVQQRYLPRAICEKPPFLQFYHILSIDSPYYEHVTSGRTIFQEKWRPIVVYVKAVRDTHPVATQKPSNDHIGIGSEVFSNEREFAGEMIKRLSPENSTIVEPFMGDCRDCSHAFGSNLHRHRARDYTILVGHEHALRRMTARCKKCGHNCDSESLFHQQYPSCF